MGICVVWWQGWDKTFCLRFLDQNEFDEVHFFGDKTFEVHGPVPHMPVCLLICCVLGLCLACIDTGTMPCLPTSLTLTASLSVCVFVGVAPGRQ